MGAHWPPPHKKCHPCPTPPPRDTGWEVPVFTPLMGSLFGPLSLPPRGCHQLNITWARQGKDGTTVLEEHIKIPPPVWPWWAPLKFGNICLLGLSLSFCKSVGEMWGHSKQVTVWMAHKESGWKVALSDFAPAKKTLNFWLWPSPCPGYLYPNKMVSCLGCPDMFPTTHKKLSISRTLWGNTMRWYSWPPSARTPGGWKGHCLSSLSTPSLSQQVAAWSSRTRFSGVWGPGKHPRGNYLNAWSDLC